MALSATLRTAAALSALFLTVLPTGTSARPLAALRLATDRVWEEFSCTISVEVTQAASAMRKLALTHASLQTPP